MFVSIGIRFEANVEALNMVESTGNYSKHRRVPYIIKEEEGYRIIYVPAISGESLAHAYQVFLVEEANEIYSSPPICEDCKSGVFFKSMNKEHLKPKVEGDISKLSSHDIEQSIVRKCLVEDIGGFLYAEKPPVRRSSAFQVSYALPIKPAVLYSITEPQLHARHAQVQEKAKGNISEQMIYYIETGTALYGFTLNLDLSAIGLSSISGEKILKDEEIKKRRYVALRALLRMISSQQFGAKLSRFFPVGGIVSVTVSVTKHPFSISSPIYEEYISMTTKRLTVLKNKFNEELSLFIYDKTEELKDVRDKDFVHIYETPEEPFVASIDFTKSKGYL